MAAHNLRCLTALAEIQAIMQQVDQQFMFEYASEYVALAPAEKQTWHGWFHESGKHNGVGNKVNRLALQVMCPEIVTAYSLNNPKTMGQLLEGLVSRGSCSKHVWIQQQAFWWHELAGHLHTICCLNSEIYALQNATVPQIHQILTRQQAQPAVPAAAPGPVVQAANP